MRRPALFRRRSVWLPTVWAWLLLLAGCGGAAAFAVRHVEGFLAPIRPVGSGVLVVEGWMPEDELDQALAAYRNGHYERVVTTGGPTQTECERAEAPSYAERARDYLVRRGLPRAAVVAVPAPASAQERSFLNAVMVREWAARSERRVHALDVFSSGVHSRRSWLLHRMALGPGVRVGIIAGKPSAYEPDTWWRTSEGAKDVLGESIAWLWTELFFHPGRPGSSEEKWAVPGPDESR